MTEDVKTERLLDEMREERDALRREVDAAVARADEMETKVEELSYELEGVQALVGDPTAAKPLADAVVAFAEWQSGGYGGDAWKTEADNHVSRQLWGEVSERVFAISGERPTLPSLVRDG